MIFSLIRPLTFLIAVSSPQSARSFELATHGVITNQAYTISALGSQPASLSRLGLVDSPSPFGNNYYDFKRSTINRRAENRFEISYMLPAARRDSQRIRGWLMRGAIREDDLSGTTSVLADPLSFGSQPWISDPDPAGNINRVCNHFLNPLNRSAMVAPAGANLANLGCPDFNVSAANWAIGTTDAFAPTPVEAGNYRNHFTVFSAREAMWRALTLTNKDGTPATRVAGDNQDQVRKAYWASTFRALGDVVHLVQDMAQPQHTRNEAHVSDTAAILEKYTEARATNARTFRFDGTTLQADATPSLPALNSYSVPRFDRYSDYWSSASGTDSLDIGKGLADYSSRGFFTPNQSLGDPFSGFPRPVNVESAYTISKTPPPGGNPCPGLVLGFPEYAWANVPDTISGVPSNPVRMGSRSLLPSRWAISRCVLLDQGNLFIPRAVAYSAGLIDYFFRGQLDITPPDEGVYSLVDHYDFSGEGKTPTDAAAGFKGFKTIKLKLRNATPDITPSGGGATAPQIMSGGTLVAVLKFHRNLRYTDDLSGDPRGNLAAAVDAYRTGRSLNEEIVVSTSIKDGNGNALIGLIPVTNTAQTYIFEFSQELPVNATDVKLQVVYRGMLGSETDAVVVQTVDISEPTYFAYINATDYIKIGESVYTRAQINAATTDGAALRSKIRPTQCINTNTNQLIDSPGCMAPTPINFPLYWNTIAPGQIGKIGLDEVGTYHRIATLNPPASTADYYLGASSCLPGDPAIVPSRTVQTNYVPDPAGSGGVIPTVTVDYVPQATRGVNGWYTTSCINNGDGSVPGVGTDDRETKMTPLTGANLKPLQMRQFKFGAP